jgi:hypothetical protein
LSGPYRDPTLNELREKYEQRIAELEAAIVEHMDIEREAEVRAEKQKRRIAELTEALAVYGQHDNDCLAGQGHAGRPTDDGNYETRYGYGSRAKWYRRGDRPECTCGLDAALKGVDQ